MTLFLRHVLVCTCTTLSPFCRARGDSQQEVIQQALGNVQGYCSTCSCSLNHCNLTHRLLADTHKSSVYSLLAIS
jgi:hypothetical protein